MIRKKDKEEDSDDEPRAPDYTKFKPRKEIKGKKEIRETVFSFPFTTEDQLKTYLKRAAGIVIPDVQVCEGHSTPWRAVCDAYFARSPVSVWIGARGLGGKTMTIGALGWAEATTLATSVNVLGGSGEQSRRVHDAMNQFWGYKSSPRYLLKGQPLQRETNLTNGGKIKALLASQASVRGDHPTRLRCDEIDEMDFDILQAALGQPQSQKKVLSQTVLSSTHQYENGTVTKILEMAKDKNWTIHYWCAKECLQPHGWLTQEEMDRKRSTMTEQSWRVEVELQRPNAESRAIRTEAVHKMFDKSLGIFRGDEGEYIEIEAPSPYGDYATGADWARSKDWTIVSTFRTDCEPMKLVAFQRAGRRDWPEMTNLLDERQRRFPGQARHDGTGLGDVINSFLMVPAKAIWMSGHSRQQIFNNYIMEIEAGHLKAPWIEYMVKEHERCTKGDLEGSGHPPDTLVSGALAISCLDAGNTELTW